MTREQLLENLQPFTEPKGIGATVYFILKSEDGSAIKLADIEADSQPEVLRQYLDYIQREIAGDEEKSVVSLSTADDRTNVIYHYDLDEVPQELTVIDQILADDARPTFSFREDDISDLQGFLILIGNNEHQLAIYKKHYPVSLPRTGSSIFLTLPASRSRISPFCPMSSSPKSR